jgi:hypothetical protein
MATTKAAGVMFLRKLLAEHGEKAEHAFLAALKPAEVKLFQTALPVTRLELPFMARFYQTATDILYPGDPLGLWKIGHAMAKDNLSGIYKFLIMFATVPYLAKQVASIWNTYYDTGKAHAELTKDQKASTVCVDDFPSLPAEIRTLTTGFIHGTVEFTSVKSVQVTLDESSPNAWKWLVSWQ